MESNVDRDIFTEELPLKSCLSIVLFMTATPLLANTAIETETAQIGKKGDIGISQSIEFEKASDGKAFGTLTQFEYGISDRAEILIEPFFHLWDIPNEGPSENGTGDLEITPSYMVVMEKGLVPALLLAMKVKVPTGDKNVGGSGQFDYYPYIILGQHFGSWIFNANFGVNCVTPEKKTVLEKTVIWDLEVERELSDKVSVFYELYSAEESVITASTAVQYQFTEHFNAFMAFAYSAEHTLIFRPGVNFEF